MNIEKIAKKLSKETGFPISDTKNIVEIIINSFRDFLKNKDRIELRGLGSFYVKKRKSRNIKLTTRYIKSPEHYGIIFRESHTLKEVLNQDVYE